jgi:hypothetical protein
VHDLGGEQGFLQEQEVKDRVPRTTRAIVGWPFFLMKTCGKAANFPNDEMVFSY